MKRGYLGISTSLSKGSKEGNKVTVDLSYSYWFTFAKTIKIYNDSSLNGEFVTLSLDATSPYQYSLLYNKYPKNTSPYMIASEGNIVPYPGKSYNLGVDGNVWNEVRANNFYGDTSQSDERVKNSIESLPNEYEVFFDKMEPTRYKYNKGTSNRYHTGFIA
jgi:hypothetical protein